MITEGTDKMADRCPATQAFPGSLVTTCSPGLNADQPPANPHQQFSRWPLHPECRLRREGICQAASRTNARELRAPRASGFRSCTGQELLLSSTARQRGERPRHNMPGRNSGTIGVPASPKDTEFNSRQDFVCLLEVTTHTNGSLVGPANVLPGHSGSASRADCDVLLAEAHGARPMRLTRSWNLGSERRGSKAGRMRTPGLKRSA
jgi:hypothetical protein